MVNYLDAGVCNDFKERVSRELYLVAKKTWENRKGQIGEVIVPFDDFSGIRAIDVSKLEEGTLMGLGSDGIGSKPKISECLDCFQTDAFNLFAMFCDDVLVRGAEPVLVSTVLDVNSLMDKNGNFREKQLSQLTSGYLAAANEANVAVLSGETAELGDRIGGYIKLPAFGLRIKQGFNYIFNGIRPRDNDFHINWSGTVVWFGRKDRLFNGTQINVGDALIGLGDRGFGSNGLSLVNKIAEMKFGSEWYKKDYQLRSGEIKNLGELVLTPCPIYTRAVIDMYGGYNKEPKVRINGFAHITGGGLPEKMKRVLRACGYGAEIRSPIFPSEIMEYFQEIGQVSDRDAYQTWHMGQRGVVISPESDKVIRIAKEHGIFAKHIGEVIKKPGINIHSEGYFSHNKVLRFE
jgi:phosphoribosylformylglycinamidine cyclo-ligase